MVDQPEVWLRGPIAGVPALLQPVAHALVQAQEDVARLAPTVPNAQLWLRPGAASAGFHLLHLAGSLDRLLTYARGEALNDAQKVTARAEAEDHPQLDGQALVTIVSQTIAQSLDQLRHTDPATLQDERRVGRTASSTVMGLLFHAAEHTTRHAGQFITTVKVLASR